MHQPWSKLGSRKMSLTAWSWEFFMHQTSPDKATGIEMTEEMFIKTIRDGKYMGVGRPFFPPMPWEVIKKP
jgi:hypothetical protein